ARILETREIDEAALRVGVDEPHAHPVADVEPLLTSLDPAFHGWVEDTDPRALGGRARDDAVEFLADAFREKQRRGGFAHHALHLLGAVFLQRALRRERGELVSTVRNLLAVERRAHQALRD